MSRQSDEISGTSRIYAQLLAFTDCSDVKLLFRPLEFSELECVLYKDVNDPLGVALLTLSVDPELFTGPLREVLSARPFRVLMQKRELSMLGHTGIDDGNTGAEPAARLRGMLADRERPWTIWCPLRRPVESPRLAADQRERLLEERRAALATLEGEIRGVLLSCHGMHGDGGELVQVLAGRHLHELSAAVERLGQVEQTAIEAGPFFVGRATWRDDEEAPAKARW